MTGLPHPPSPSPQAERGCQNPPVGARHASPSHFWQKSNLWRRIVGSILCLLLLALWFYREQHPPDNDGTWARVQQTGVLRVGMDASYIPFSDTPNGVPTGLDVDLINEIGRRLGVRVEIVNMGFDGLYPALQSNQVDALISALSIDPAQLGWAMYTYSYIDAGQVIASHGAAYHRMAELDGQTLAVEYGSIGDEVARQWARRLRILKVAHFTTSNEAMGAVRNGQADAALIDYITARVYLRAHPGLALSQEFVTHDTYAIATRLTSYDLAGAISDAIAAMEQDGTLDRIIGKWL